jgi:hypothetical protein
MQYILSFFSWQNIWIRAMILPAVSVTNILFLMKEWYHFLIHDTHAQLNEINDNVIYIEIDMWGVIFLLGTVFSQWLHCYHAFYT